MTSQGVIAPVLVTGQLTALGWRAYMDNKFCKRLLHALCKMSICSNIARLLNRYTPSKRKGHWPFPLLSFSGIISYLSKQGTPALNSSQRFQVDRATR